MPVNNNLTCTIHPDATFYRITTLRYLTPKKTRDYPQVVNGAGGKGSKSRYNAGSALTVYLTDDVETCLAEKMFYFHLKTLNLLNEYQPPGHSSMIGAPPPVETEIVLWVLRLNKPISNVADLTKKDNCTTFEIIHSLLKCPLQDYRHLGDHRTYIEGQGYKGLKVNSSRSNSGNLIVLFEDQSRNVAHIQPYRLNFRLIKPVDPMHSVIEPFVNFKVDPLEYWAGQVKYSDNNLNSSVPAFLLPYQDWQTVYFNR